MIELQKVHVEDHLLTLSRVPDSFIDLTVTSPPYDDMGEDFIPIVSNGLRDYHGYSWDFKNLAQELYRTTKEGGVVVWVVNDPVVDGSESLASSFQKIYFRKAGFNIHDTMIYEKNSSAMPDKTRYLQVFEYMIVLSKGRPKTINFIEDRHNRFGQRWGKGRVVREKDGTLSPRENYVAKKEGKRYNIWKYNTGAGYSAQEAYCSEHPAIFPEALAADQVRSWSNPGEIVYDPFGGSGTVAKVCEILGRKWFISEISQKYADLSNRRLSDLRAKPQLYNQ